VTGSFGRRMRLRRLYRYGDDHLFVVPLDHSINDGPLGASMPTDRLVGTLAAAGVDAVVLHKGTARHIDPSRFAGTALIVHLSASTVRATDPDAKYLVAGVEEALRYGADAVSTHVNLGSRSEERQIADTAAVADACDRWNVPLLAMIYPRGPGISDPASPELVAHAVTLGVDLGADIVKTVRTESDVAMKDIVSASPVPVIVAGGPRISDQDSIMAYVSGVLGTGAAGVAMGRNVFQTSDPGAIAARVTGVVHRRSDEERAS
jgi:2-amino-4,5-dihydroxy-6-oxo-7-(phosphonooxy)heptanoate synthase